MKDLWASKVLTSKDFVMGINKFMLGVPDVVMDIPKLASLLSKSLVDLIQMGAVVATDITWVPKEQSEDDMLFVEIYYKLMARLL